MDEVAVVLETSDSLRESWDVDADMGALEPLEVVPLPADPEDGMGDSRISPVAVLERRTARTPSEVTI